MKRNWTNIAKDFNSTDEQKVALSEAFDALEWEPLVKGMSLPMCTGLGIQEVIKQCRIPKVSHIAIAHHLAPFGLYGIRGHYTNGRADVYCLDRGSDILILASDFYEKEAVTV